MGSFGERLRREREMRGISLDEIATQTKISARNLRALEEEKFDQLPGGIFNKGFVRAYAKFLGIDEEHIVSEYVAASQDTEAAREQKLKDEFAKAEFRKEKSDDREISLEPKSQWGTIAAIVLIAVLAFAGWQYYQKRKAQRAQQHSQQTVPVQATPAPATPNPASSQPGTDTVPPATASSEPGTQQAPPQNPNDQAAATTNQSATGQANKTEPQPAASDNSTPSPIDLKVKVSQPSWVSIKADGKLLVSDNLPSGTERSVRAHEKVEMVLGNAGGVELTYNGKPVENLAKGQDVRRITFTPSGYQ